MHKFYSFAYQFSAYSIMLITIFCMNLIAQKRNTFQVDIRKRSKAEFFKAKRQEADLSDQCNSQFQQFLKESNMNCIPRICAINYQLIAPALIDKFLFNYTSQFQHQAQIRKAQNISFITKLIFQKKIIFPVFFQRAIEYCVYQLKIKEKMAVLQKCCVQCTQFSQQIVQQDFYFNCMIEYFASCLSLNIDYKVQQVQIMVDSLFVWVFNQKPSINLNYYSFCLLYNQLLGLLQLKGKIANRLSQKTYLIGEALILNLVNNGYFSLQFLKIISKILDDSKNLLRKSNKFVQQLLTSKNFRDLIQTGIFCDQYVFNKTQYHFKKFQNQIPDPLELKFSVQNLIKSSQQGAIQGSQFEVNQIKQITFNIFAMLPQIKYLYFPIQLIDELIHQMIEMVYKKNQYQENALIQLYNFLVSVYQQQNQGCGLLNKTRRNVRQLLQSILVNELDYERVLKSGKKMLLQQKLDFFYAILWHVPCLQTFKKILLEAKIIQDLKQAINSYDKEYLNLDSKICQLIHILNQNQDVFRLKKQQWKLILIQLLSVQIRQIQMDSQTQKIYKKLMEQITMQSFKE